MAVGILKRTGIGRVRAGGKRKTRHIAPKVLAGFLLFAVLCVLPVFENTAIGYLPALTFLFAIAIAFAYPRILASRLEFDLIMDCAECVRDTDVKLLARFHNPLPLICPRIDVEFRISDIFGNDDTTSDFSFSLGPKRTRDFPFGARFAHIGTVTAGVKRVTVHDPFGIFRCAVEVQGERSIEVLPRTYQPNADIMQSLQPRESLDAITPFNRDGMEYTGVREYAYGDPLKSIHWKLSSHSDGVLYTRLFDAVGDPSVHILCGTEFGKHDSQLLMTLYDAEAETALSLFDYGLGAALRMTLSFPDRSKGVVSFDNAHRVDRYNFVKSFPIPNVDGESDGSGALPDLVTKAASSARDGGNLLVCAAVLDEALVEALTLAVGRHKQVILFFFAPSGLTQRERSDLLRPLGQLKQGGVLCYPLTSASELEGLKHE